MNISVLKLQIVMPSLTIMLNLGIASCLLNLSLHLLKLRVATEETNADYGVALCGRWSSKARASIGLLRTEMLESQSIVDHDLRELGLYK